MKALLTSFAVAMALLFTPLPVAAYGDTLLNPGLMYAHSFGSRGSAFGAEVSVMHFPRGLLNSAVGYGAFAQAQGTTHGALRLALSTSLVWRATVMFL